METNKKSPKIPLKFYCEMCDYYTSNKKDYSKHLLTLKHQNYINTNSLTNKNPQKSPKNNIYECNCGKVYKHLSSLCKHKNNCNFIEPKNIQDLNNTNLPDKDLIMMLVNQNTELMEILKNGTNNNNNNNQSHNTNSLNKTFNLQFFLNETCKDAMNIMDFVDSIQLQLSDLEKVGEIGYVEGISNIITSKLKSLDVTQRPIHCTDKKREVLYIKDEDKWEKEDEQKKKVRKAIKRVASKNIQLLPKFKEAHPDCIKAASRFSDQYNKMIVESMGGSGDNDLEKEDKIIRKITNVTTIDKAM
uniref:C2H2-type domain-containing protein n=1 Tax=viral metagenome TaxID=1070528 RepID=A0A6C0AS55_9ZZZZ